MAVQSTTLSVLLKNYDSNPFDAPESAAILYLSPAFELRVFIVCWLQQSVVFSRIGNELLRFQATA